MDEFEKKEEILANYRRAYRLINYVEQSFVTCVCSLFNKTRFAGLELEGRAFFSKDKATSKIASGKWGWDFLPGYVFEYYCENEKKERLGLLKISDNGFYLSSQGKKYDVQNFCEIEKAESLVILQYRSAGERSWCNVIEKEKKDGANTYTYKEEESNFNDRFNTFIATKEDKPLKDIKSGGLYYAKKYSMESVCSNEGIIKVIEEFSNDIKNISDTGNLNIDELISKT